MKNKVELGKWSEDEITDILQRSSSITDIGSRIRYLSGLFLGTPYKSATLVGDHETTELLVINFEGMDCFTFLDYVEAMRLSGDFQAFTDHLKKIRYHGDFVSYETRNHFFTDWIRFNKDTVRDITGKIAGTETRTVMKTLNLKEDGTFFLPGIEPCSRPVTYIPSDRIDDRILSSLKTGDYGGIYSNREGLDVTHVGIIVKTGDRLFLRHASSAKTALRVIDQDLEAYIKGKPGFMILRPR